MNDDTYEEPQMEQIPVMSKEELKLRFNLLQKENRMMQLFAKKMTKRMAKPKHRDVVRMQKELKRERDGN